MEGIDAILISSRNYYASRKYNGVRRNYYVGAWAPTGTASLNLFLETRKPRAFVSGGRAIWKSIVYETIACRCIRAVLPPRSRPLNEANFRSLRLLQKRTAGIASIQFNIYLFKDKQVSYSTLAARNGRQGRHLPITTNFGGGKPAKPPFRKIRQIHRNV